MAGLYVNSRFMRPEEIRFFTKSDEDGRFALFLYFQDDTLLHLCGLDRSNMEALYASIGATLQDADETEREREDNAGVNDTLPAELTLPDHGNQVG